jgi:signal transduction histidine kinase
MIVNSQNRKSSGILEDKLDNKRSKSLNILAYQKPQQSIPNRSGSFNPSLVNELRNPLTNIKLAAELLRSGDLYAEQKMFTDIIIRGVDRLNKLITDQFMIDKNGGFYLETKSEKDTPY